MKSLVGNKDPNSILPCLSIWLIIVGITALADCLGPKVLKGLKIVIGNLKDFS